MDIFMVRILTAGGDWLSRKSDWGTCQENFAIVSDSRWSSEVRKEGLY